MTGTPIETRPERWTGKRAADFTDDDRKQAHAAGYEPGPDGYMVGRDPRQMTVAEIEAIGHARMSAPDTIRAKCLDCCAGSPNEVRLCPAITCPSWPRRMGSDPWRQPASEAKREAARATAARMHAARRNHGTSPASDAGTSDPVDGGGSRP